MKKYFYFVAAMILLLLVVACEFYWFQLNPYEIRKICNDQATEKVKKAYKDAGTSEGYADGYEMLYNMCIRAKGLKE